MQSQTHVLPSTRSSSAPTLAIFLLCLLVLFGVGAPASAAPFELSAVLSGDLRPSNPDNLSVLVTITGDTTSDVASFTVDLQSVLHPSAALHEFYFNLVGATANYSLSNFTPGTWSLTATDVKAKGSGAAQFMFETSGPNNTVTNSVDLTFDVTKLTGNFAVSDFLTAATSCSNDLVLGCGQLGAHIGSLGATGNDSGFALGNYVDRTDTNVGGVPEPASLTLLVLGACGALGYRRRAARSNPQI